MVELEPQECHCQSQLISGPRAGKMPALPVTRGAFDLGECYGMSYQVADAPRYGLER
jgi:hypothetical protein